MRRSEGNTKRLITKRDCHRFFRVRFRVRVGVWARVMVTRERARLRVRVRAGYSLW